VTMKPDFSFVYDGLKDFQKLSVDYIFNRLYMDADQVNRFLLADEVGLGKTLVAKGIIAKSLDYLWDKIERLDIIYICSNSDIARQNIGRLKLTKEGLPLASRITLLPEKLKELNQNKLNFISLTPGTSFNLRSSTGKIRERALIYSILRDAWGFKDDIGPLNMMQCSAYRKNWREYVEWYLLEEGPQLDEELVQGFIDALQKKPDLKREFFKLARFYRADEEQDMPWRERNNLIGELRFTLATSCIQALKPDIIILDEFQRFKYLLDDQDPMSKLAQHLFNYQDFSKTVNTKILLLSATPYKMYTMYHENEEDDHYKDFLRTLRFLYNSEAKTAEVKKLLHDYRYYLYSPDPHNSLQLKKVKEEIESRLRRVMVRTERLAVSDDRNGMVKNCYSKCNLETNDLIGFNVFDNVCRALGVGDHLEFWKSSPFLINLMDDYSLKRKLRAKLEEPDHYDLLEKHIQGPEGLLRWSAINKYKNIDYENPKLRNIIRQNVDKGWQLLWTPPSLLYYQPGGKFSGQEAKEFTKMLVFSSWKVVPKAVAALCSYEAERRAITEYNQDLKYDELNQKIAPLLQFTHSEGRLTGMPALALLYPCLTLAKNIDPLKIALEHDNQLTREEMFEVVKQKVAGLFNACVVKENYPDTGPFDEKWYWAALALLDRNYNMNVVEAWLNEQGKNAFSRVLDSKQKSETESRFYEHVEEFTGFFNCQEEPGRIPEDLIDVLAKLALASPAVIALRGLDRKVKSISNNGCLFAAAKIAAGFRSLFNLPVSISIVRERKQRVPYWESVLDYSLDGNLQAVLDEYIHVLYESIGLKARDDDQVVIKSIRDAVHSAVSLRTTRAEFDDFKTNKQKRLISREAKNIRCRYALRREESITEEGEVTREEQVRGAFNSPFRPFIIVTTSIGQEGLDFHQYCHAICHWNLPSNPVDFEQREGRIHRYKGHVIRKNLAEHYGLDGLRKAELPDPWDNLFNKAVLDREPTGNDLVPYWHFKKGNNGSNIERHLPVLPMSRDVNRIEALKRGLVLYRMVFGQPRQEDLMNFLRGIMDDERMEEMLNLKIDLEPKL